MAYNISNLEEKKKQYKEYLNHLHTLDPIEYNRSVKSSKYPPSFGINHYIETLKKLDEATILNLSNPKYVTKNFNEIKYDKFISHFYSVIRKVSSELDNLKGPIIEYYILPEYQLNDEYKTAMNEIVDKYKKLYLNDIKNDGKHKLTENDTDIFPNYLDDLYTQHNKPYIDFETKNGLDKPIVEQTDEEFYDTLRLRIQGLKECQDKLGGQFESAKQYFIEEYERENKIYDDLNFPKINTKTKAISIDNKISSQCKTIYYNDKMLEDSKNITQNKELQTKVFKNYETWLSNPNEIEFAKTFLPAEYFTNQKTKTQEEFTNELFGNIKLLILSNNRDYRQCVFGKFEDKEFTNYLKYLKPFLFEVGGMLKSEEQTVSCNPFVNWSILLNLLYCRCAISNTNPEVLCPVRFIIPEKAMINYNEPNETLEFEIKNRKPLIEVFGECKFIGIITIKYFHEETQTFRIWFLYIFENLDFKNARKQFNGIREKYFILNSKLKFVNTGSFSEYHNITHTELTFFCKLAEINMLYFYKTKFDNRNIFISKKNNLESENSLSSLGIKPITIKVITKEFKGHLYPTHSFIMTNIMKGGNINKLYNLYEITKTMDETKLLYNNVNICGVFYNDYFKNATFIRKYHRLLDDNKLKIVNIINILNNFYLINVEKNLSNKYKIIKITREITKFKPILSGIKFYENNEILNNYNIIKILKKNSKILYLGSSYSFIETLKYNKYNANNTTFIFIKHKINKYILEEFTKYINTISKLYKSNIIYFDNKNYNLLNFEYINNESVKKYDLFYYNIHSQRDTLFENHYNTFNILMGALLGLKHTEIGGVFILHFGSVAYKHLADIYVIIAEYFDNHSLYYPEISNLYKKTGTYGIFTGFKGINDVEFNELLKLLDKTNEIYPNDGADFNIYDEKLREELDITKPIDPNISHQTNIIGYLDDKLMNDNNYIKIYEYIRNFNNERYYKQLSFIYKMLELLKQPNEYINNLKLPTQEQLTNAILYCKKYDIPYIDKFSTPAFQDKFGKKILHEAYGLHDPIIYKFKTPFKLHLGPKSILSLKFNPSSRKSSRKSSKTNSKTSSRIKSSIKKKTKKSSSFRMSNFFSKSSISSKSKSHKYNQPLYNKNKRTSTLKNNPHLITSNLIPELEFSNNRIEQTTKLIDSRRDFDAPDTPHDMQNAKWFEANKRFRYYKHKDDKEKIHLDVLVRSRLKDNGISQAWLKMYEIITDCQLVPTGRKGTYKSFHICEAPGTFINCLNNYIHTKTKYDTFEWKAQSLRKSKDTAKGTAFGDDFGLIKNNKERWDWGIDGTGDITNIGNIHHYAKVVKDMQKNMQKGMQKDTHNPHNPHNQHIDLITSDCGLPMKCEGYEKVAFASLLAILYILPKGGSMVYKIFSPIDEPIILNLIYIAYTNFKDFIFYKPVQNSQSREFYIIGKGYLGTEPTIIEKLFDELKKFKQGEEVDLFADTYLESFVRQMVQASTILADNFVYTIERQIYFVDNSDVITPDFIKLFYDYYNEKNKDWLDKYNPQLLVKAAPKH